MERIIGFRPGNGILHSLHQAVIAVYRLCFIQDRAAWTAAAIQLSAHTAGRRSHLWPLAGEPLITVPGGIALIQLRADIRAYLDRKELPLSVFTCLLYTSDAADE